jgi:hypothetical protein
VQCGINSLPDYGLKNPCGQKNISKTNCTALMGEGCKSAGNPRGMGEDTIIMTPIVINN